MSNGGRYGGDDIDFNALPRPEKTLYEQLKENRDKKNELYEQKAASRNATKRLDVSEVKHYDELRQKERKRELEDRQEVWLAREKRATFDKVRKYAKNPKSKPKPLPLPALGAQIKKHRTSGLGITKKTSDKSSAAVKKEDVKTGAAVKVEKKTLVAYDSDSD